MNFARDDAEQKWSNVAKAFADEYTWEMVRSLREESAEQALDRDALSFYRELGKRGFVGLSFPPPHGQGLSAGEAFSFVEEIEAAGLPSWGIAQNEGVGALIVHSGSDELRAEHLPALVAAKQRYVNGLSEPEAGSDLLALRTTARREGDEYVISGSKLWTSGAHLADYVSTLVRTDPTQRSSKGLSVILVPTSAAGVEIQPVWTMGGWRVNAVFFDDVRVPVANRIGEENEGMRVLARRLDTERAMSFGGTETRLLLARVIHRLAGRADDLDDGQLAEFGEHVADCEADRLIYLAVSAKSARGEDTSGFGPMSKLHGSELSQRVAQWVADAFLPDSLYPHHHDADVLAADVEEAVRTSTFLTIIGGTSEIQRNTIATRLLGLAKGT